VYITDVKVEELRIGAMIAQPVLKDKQKFISENTRVDKNILKRLQQLGIDSVSIRTKYPPKNLKEANSNDSHNKSPINKSKAETIRQQLRFREIRKKIEGKEVSSSKIKPVLGDTLREEAVENIRQLFTEIETSENIQNNTITAHKVISKSDEIVKQLEMAITADPEGHVHIYDLKQYDEYTFHHSLSVALLSIVTGKQCGLDYWDIMKLGQCAFLHDIGKQKIPIEIINKKGKLTDEEFKIVQQHPVHGASILENTILSDDVRNGVKYHHEKLSGRGYPEGISGKDIPLFSRIISVADVFDALTSYRPYRDPMTPHKACEIIISEINTSFDYDVVTNFVAKLELYPVNAIVELADERIGIVVDNNNKLNPIVELLETGERLDLHKVKDQLEIMQVIYPNDIESI